MPKDEETGTVPRPRDDDEEKIQLDHPKDDTASTSSSSHGTTTTTTTTTNTTNTTTNNNNDYKSRCPEPVDLDVLCPPQTVTRSRSVSSSSSEDEEGSSIPDMDALALDDVSLDVSSGRKGAGRERGQDSFPHGKEKGGEESTSQVVGI